MVGNLYAKVDNLLWWHVEFVDHDGIAHRGWVAQFWQKPAQRSTEKIGLASGELDEVTTSTQAKRSQDRSRRHGCHT